MRTCCERTATLRGPFIAEKGGGDLDLYTIDKLRIEERGKDCAAPFDKNRLNSALLSKKGRERFEIHALGTALRDMPSLHPLVLETGSRLGSGALACSYNYERL